MHLYSLCQTWLNLKTHTVSETENRTSCLTTVSQTITVSSCQSVLKGGGGGRKKGGGEETASSICVSGLVTDGRGLAVQQRRLAVRNRERGVGKEKKSGEKGLLKDPPVCDVLSIFSVQFFFPLVFRSVMWSMWHGPLFCIHSRGPYFMGLGSPQAIR